jgi:hypothetical protein
VYDDRMMPTKSMSTFSASLTNLAAILPQSHDCSFYVSRPILAPLTAETHWSTRNTTSCTLPNRDIRLGSPTLPASEAGDFVELLRLWLLEALSYPPSSGARETLHYTPCVANTQQIMALWGGFTKLRKATISFIMSVRPSLCQCAWNSSSPTGWICVKNSHWRLLLNSEDEVQIC